MRRCGGIKPDGGQCTLTVEPPETYCWHHTPERAEERRRTASRAARSKGTREVANLKDEVKNVIAGVESGNLDRSDAAVMLQGYRVLKDLVELSRRVKETDELLGRVAALERGRELEKGTRTWAT